MTKPPWTARLTDEEMEELGFQWTGQRLPYAKMDARFIARARQIVEPVLAMRLCGAPHRLGGAP